MAVIGTVEDLVKRVITPNKKISFGGAALFLKPMEVVREIIRQGIKELEIYTLIGDLDIDLLLGVNAVKELHSSYVGLPMVGMAKHFRNAIEKEQNVIFKEWTELSMVRAFQAGAMGTPAIMLRSLLGSDLVKLREDFEEVTYGGKEYIQVPAIVPDLAIVHAYAADKNGNVYYPKHHALDEFSTLPAHCAKELFVTVEKVITNEEGRKLIQQGQATMFSSIDTDYVAEAPKGAWPSGFPPFYASDMGHIMTYSGMAQMPETFEMYLQEYVFGTQEAENR
ncbi:MAG: CoA transferase subunit A [Candidatus Hodarchaeales archaeon]|jgi:glutaconate CoA-transferase subunit A